MGAYAISGNFWIRILKYNSETADAFANLVTEACYPKTIFLALSIYLLIIVVARAIFDFEKRLSVYDCKVKV